LINVKVCWDEMNGELEGYYPHGKNQVLGWKFVPLPLLPPQIPHRIAYGQFPASGVIS
jgi:hypothetical protein